jgi:hypothetical protein
MVKTSRLFVVSYLLWWVKERNIYEVRRKLYGVPRRLVLFEDETWEAVVRPVCSYT